MVDKIPKALKGRIIKFNLPIIIIKKNKRKLHKSKKKVNRIWMQESWTTKTKKTERKRKPENQIHYNTQPLW